jgi:hypothetical protein
VGNIKYKLPPLADQWDTFVADVAAPPLARSMYLEKMLEMLSLLSALR